LDSDGGGPLQRAPTDSVGFRDDDAEAGRTFGARLRGIRQGVGLSLAVLAQETFYSKGYLSKVESGAKPPTHELAARCDDVLDTGGTLAALVDQERPASASALLARPAQLPAPATNFTGRTTAIRVLDTALLQRRRGETEVPVVVISGMGGCGKTALATRWAHRAAARFPDGVLFTDLRGFGPAGRPASPEAVLTAFLHALGVPAASIPTAPDALAGAYRTTLHNRRVLVVLDNAADARQVRPLIPGSARCGVIVTSRSRLPGLVTRDGATPVRLGAFTPQESASLIAMITGSGGTDEDERSAYQLAELCAHLPLALRVAAERLATPSDLRIDERIAHLADHRTRLDALSSPDDPDSDVRAVLSWSFDALPAPTRHLLSLLGRYSGGSVTPPAAAALAGLDLDRTRAMLSELSGVHLLEETPDGRYRFHDLFHLYAAERGEPDAVAAERLGRWYVAETRRATRLATPTLSHLPGPDIRPAVTASFHDASTAMSWLDRERITILALINQAVSMRFDETAWLLADAARGYFNQRRYVSDWTTAARSGLAAALHSGDTRARAAMTASLALAASATSDYPRAERLNRAALRLAHACSWDTGIAMISNNLGGVLSNTGQLDRARDAYREAIARNRSTGNTIGEAIQLGNLGGIHRSLNEWDEALACYAAALAIHTGLGARDSAALMYVNRASVHLELGRPDEAYRDASHALHEYEATGSQFGQCLADMALSGAYRDQGALVIAQDRAQRARIRAVDIGDRRLEADSLNLLGTIAARDGMSAESTTHHQDALRISLRIRYEEGVRGARRALTGRVPASPSAARGVGA
jgi:tetratricopeptide (TPR) repeat protein/transcriptional regulator with XRE-family HTH domain